MAESAKDQVRRIKEETARRKAIWAQMQRAAHEALRAVTPEARRRGIRGQNWLGGEYSNDCVYVSFPSYLARLNEDLALRQKLSHAESLHSFCLRGSGTLERPSKDTAYEGYPDVQNADVKIFREAAVETLMASLNSYILRMRQQQRGKR